MSFFLNVLRYYSGSSFNMEETQNPDLARRTLERLEALPIVNVLTGNFKKAIDKIMQQSKTQMSLYSFRLLEVFCHSTSLVSFRIFEKVKECRFYEKLIELLFKNENCSILHMLIERAFLHVFVTEKHIYDLYKKYLFC